MSHQPYRSSLGWLHRIWFQNVMRLTRDERPLWLYVVAERGKSLQDGDPVKIGKTRDLRARLQKIQLGHPTDLEYVAIIPCESSHELLIHHMFRYRRARANKKGEWFKYDSDIGAFVNDMSALLPLIWYAERASFVITDILGHEWEISIDKDRSETLGLRAVVLAMLRCQIEQVPEYDGMDEDYIEEAVIDTVTDVIKGGIEFSRFPDVQA